MNYIDGDMRQRLIVDVRECGANRELYGRVLARELPRSKSESVSPFLILNERAGDKAIAHPDRGGLNSCTMMIEKHDFPTLFVHFQLSSTNPRRLPIQRVPWIPQSAYLRKFTDLRFAAVDLEDLPSG